MANTRRSAFWAIATGLLLAMALPATAAGLTGEQVLRKALAHQQAVRDYSADIRVSVDMPGMKMPERRATIYFKQPNRYHIESKGMVMIPRKALDMRQLADDLGKHGMITIAATSRRNGVPIYFLKVVPREAVKPPQRLLVWVRGDNFTVEKMETYSGDRRELSVAWEHQLVGGKYWMLKRLVADVDVPGGGMRDRGEKPQPKSQRGTITVVFSNVRANKGLPDSLFVEPKR